MRKSLIRAGSLRLLVLAVVAVMLSACSTTTQPEGADGDKIQAEFATNPSPVKAKQEAELVATVAGLKTTAGVDVYFEVKKEGDKRRTIVKIDEGSGDKGVYTAKYTFADAAKYDVYVHVVTPTEHETEKKILKVEG